MEEQNFVPPANKINSPNCSTEELFEPAESAPQAEIEPYKKKGKGGRERTYAEVRKVILFRHKMGHFQPDLSQDMKDYYEFWYFEKPNKRKDKDKYERHVRAWERGLLWITGLDGA